jgi:hypothetical protein
VTFAAAFVGDRDLRAAFVTLMEDRAQNPNKTAKAVKAAVENS